MSNFKGNITRTRGLLSQAVQHLDDVNACRNSNITSNQEQDCNFTRPTNIGSASSHVNLHYSFLPNTSSVQHDNPTSSEKRALFRPMTCAFGPTFHPVRPTKKKKKLAMWQHDFVCLSFPMDNRATCNMSKAELIRAGLGLKQLQFFAW